MVPFRPFQFEMPLCHAHEEKINGELRSDWGAQGRQTLDILIVTASLKAMDMDAITQEDHVKEEKLNNNL